MSTKELQNTPVQASEHALVSHEDAATQAVAAREQASIQAAIVSAKRFPRNEAAAFETCLLLSKRPTFAKQAIYSKPAGGKKHKGPSVQLARALQQKWGNIHTFPRELPAKPGWCHLQVSAIDLETNVQTQAEDLFHLRIWRRDSGWINLTDWNNGNAEQDIFGLKQRKITFVERTAILKLMPPDLIEDVMDACKVTTLAVARGDIKANPLQAQRALISAFSDVHVTVEMLEKYLGHPMDEVDGAEVDDLRTVFKSIRDGAATRDDHFSTSAAVGGAKVEDINKQIKAKAAAQEKAKAEPKPKPAAKAKAQEEYPTAAEVVETPVVETQPEGEPWPSSDASQESEPTIECDEFGQVIPGEGE